MRLCLRLNTHEMGVCVGGGLHSDASSVEQYSRRSLHLGMGLSPSHGLGSVEQEPLKNVLKPIAQSRVYLFVCLFPNLYN